MYETIIPIHVALSSPDADLGQEIDDVTDQLELIDERTPELLDYVVSSDHPEPPDVVVFELIVEADDDLQALSLALSWVRTAIHATDGNTTGWAIEGVVSVAAPPAREHQPVGTPAEIIDLAQRRRH